MIEKTKKFFKKVLLKAKGFLFKVKDKSLLLLTRVKTRINKRIRARKIYGRPFFIEYPAYIIYNVFKGFIRGFKIGHQHFKIDKTIALSLEKHADRTSGEEA